MLGVQNLECDRVTISVGRTKNGGRAPDAEKAVELVLFDRRTDPSLVALAEPGFRAVQCEPLEG